MASDFRTDDSCSKIPSIPSYSLGNGSVMVECPFCEGVHKHGEDTGTRLSHCWRIEGEESHEYSLLPSTPAPEWMRRWGREPWVSKAADGLLLLLDIEPSSRRKILQILLNAFRHFPDFAERVAISEIYIPRETAEISEIETLLQSTGETDLSKAAQIVLRRIS